LSHISARTALGDAKKVSENYTHIELTNQQTKQSSSMSKEWVPAVFLERSRKFAAALLLFLSCRQMCSKIFFMLFLTLWVGVALLLAKNGDWICGVLEES
jgi:hypothetical protein